MTVLLQQGKLEQVCPACGRNEAAGYHCSGCARPTGPDEWFRNSDLAERHARLATAGSPLENPQTPLKRHRGRPRKETVSA